MPLEINRSAVKGKCQAYATSNMSRYYRPPNVFKEDCKNKATVTLGGRQLCGVHAQVYKRDQAKLRNRLRRKGLL